MRRYGNVWDQLTSFENLYAAARKARRGKRAKPAVEAFEFDLERRLVELRQGLGKRPYRPGPFRTFTITDPKPRLISAAPYIGRVVHHALCNVLEPIFERSFIFEAVTKPCYFGHSPYRTTCRSIRRLRRAHSRHAA